jgi:hypothetical protein
METLGLVLYGELGKDRWWRWRGMVTGGCKVTESMK